MLLKRIFTIISLLFLAACTPQVAFSQNQVAPPGSFLRHRADSIKALVAELSSNSTVTARYARHFGTTPDTIINYFRDNLTLITLKKPVRKTVYFIGKNGKIISKQKTLPAGHRVFAAKSGELILEWRCGNPLLTYLPAPPKTTTPIVQTMPAPVVPTLPEAPTIQVASANPIEVGQIPPPVSTVAPVLEELQAPIVTSIEPAIAPVISATPPIWKSGLPWLVPLVVGIGSSKSPHNPVPEPSALLTLSAGLSAVGFFWRRQRRR